MKCKHLFDPVLLDDAIPITELPPRILTEIFNKTDAQLKTEWNNRTNDQLTAMYDALPEGPNLPSREEVLEATMLQRPLQSGGTHWMLCCGPKTRVNYSIENSVLP